MYKGLKQFIYEGKQLKINLCDIYFVNNCKNVNKKVGFY